MSIAVGEAMSGGFDPYYTWLGIAPEEQPPHHYRLLGIRLFEDNPEAIAHAADERMMHLRTFQTGRHAAYSQWLLNEVASARVCLLNSASKAAYDQQLRQVVATRGAVAAPPPAPPAPPPPPPPSAGVGLREGPPEPLRSAPGAPPEDRAEPAARAWRQRATVLGAAGVGLLLAVILLIWAIWLRPSKTQPAALIFDWPEGGRHKVALTIDGQPAEFPAKGKLVFPCDAGEHQIRAELPGCGPYEETVTLRAGQRKEIPVPEWPPPAPPQLILQWPAKERDEAQLEFDGRPAKISPRADPEQLKVKTLALGPHKVRISRKGFKPFEQEFMLVPGKDVSIRPQWQSDEPAKPPEAGKHPVPSPTDQKEIAEGIEKEEKLAEAKTPQQKAAAAKKLLERGKSDREFPPWRFVMLLTCMEFSAAAGQADLLLEALGAAEKDFQVAVPEFRRQAVGKFIRTAPDPSRIAGVTRTDDQVLFGDGYWDWAQSAAAETKVSLLSCAGHWYQQADCQVADGAVRQRLAQRLQQVAQIEAEQRQKQEAAAKTKEEADRKAKEQQLREQRYAEAMKPVEDLAVAWDFRGAAAALARVEFKDEPLLPPRRDARADQLKRMADIKQRMIAKINQSSPRLKKSDLMLRGQNGEVTNADEEGITAMLPGGKPEGHGWRDLGEKTRQQLCQWVIDRESGDDWVGVGLLAMVCGDITLAEKCFDKAVSLGTDAAVYLEPLARAVFARAQDLLDNKDFAKAEAALAGIEQRYGKTPWFAAQGDSFQSARTQALAGVKESEAEQLYSQAAELFAQKQLFELRPIVEKLKTDYAKTKAAGDPKRTPSLAEMEWALVGLGQRVTVRQDGQGDYKTIEEAIDAVPANSLIEIQDHGPYNEKILIPKEKTGLTLRGKKGLWPVITSAGPQKSNFPRLFELVQASAALERLVLSHAAPAGDNQRCVQQFGPGVLWIRSCLLWGADPAHTLNTNDPAETVLENCLLIKGGDLDGKLAVRDTIVINGSFGHLRRSVKLENVFLGGRFDPESACELRNCTIPNHVRLRFAESALVDCIVSSVEATQAGNRIEHCNVYGKQPFADFAKPGVGCIGLDPQFVDPRGFDYRLGPLSPCRNKASDGKDLGLRFTPEMLELIKLANELRIRGILRF